MSKTDRRFFFHYNKPASQQAKEPLMSVHYKGICHIVKQVHCLVPCESKIRPRQPRVVMQGFSSLVAVKDGIAVIR